MVVAAAPPNDQPLARTVANLAKRMAPPAKPLPVVSTADLIARQAALQEKVVVLATLEVFSADAPGLHEAWEKRRIEEIDVILKDGDVLTRTSWQRAIDAYNVAANDIDAARATLRQRLAQAEALLASFDIDPATVALAESKELVGFAVVATRKRFITEKLDYTQGISLNVGRVVRGDVPWQVAAAMGAGLIAWTLINRSRALRKLKDMEGAILEKAEAARGDFATISALFTTRIIPQFDGLLRTIEALERQIGDLGVCDPGNPQSREEAFALACVLREGKQLLEMTAGD